MAKVRERAATLTGEDMAAALKGRSGSPDPIAAGGGCLWRAAIGNAPSGVTHLADELRAPDGIQCTAREELAPIAEGMADLVAGVTHFADELGARLTKFAVPLAVRAVPFAPHFLAGVRHLTPHFSTRAASLGHRFARLRPAFPPPTGQGRHRSQESNGDIFHSVSPCAREARHSDGKAATSLTS